MQFMEFELKNFEGIVSNISTPNINQSSECRNLNIHSKPGSLTVREGYSLRYSKPIDARIIESTFLTFNNFYDSQKAEGKELTLLIQKGTVVSQDGSINYEQNGLQFWLRPYWDGSAWIDNWQWLNETTITKITQVNNVWTEENPSVPYPYLIKVAGNYNAQDWVIINHTKNEIAFVLSSVVDGAETRICHSLYSNTWNQDDVIILMRNYIPLTELSELYNCTQNDISFHKVLNDLIIGFGSKPNRIGINVGLREKAFKIKSLFPPETLHADITSSKIQAINTINRHCLTTYNIYKGDYQLNFELLTASTNQISGKRYFKMTGILDGFEEILLVDTSIECSGQKIRIRPSFRFGDHNLRLTHLKIYMATDEVENASCELLRTIEIAAKDWQSANNNFYLNNAGYICLDDETTIELNSEETILKNGSNSTSLTGITVDSIPSGAIISNDSYILKIAGTSPDFNIFNLFFPIANLKQDTPYDITFRANASVPGYVIVTFLDINKKVVSNMPQINIGNSLITYSTILKTNADLTDLPYYIHFRYVVNGPNVWLDALSVKESLVIDILETTKGQGEISSLMGYTPTKDLVLSWDQAIVFNGRTYFLNPFVDKSYPNKIIFSVIAGSGAFMYSTATPENFLDIEKFNGQNTVGMALMQNLNILVLLDNSAVIVDPLTNSIRELGFGIGTVAKQSIVNMEGNIFWASENDIYMIGAVTGYAPTNLTETTIRNKYRAIAAKGDIIAIRDKFNCYCFVDPLLRDNAGAKYKIEYLLTSKGWIERVRSHFPEVYQLGTGNIVWFMSQGDIYSG